MRERHECHCMLFLKDDNPFALRSQPTWTFFCVKIHRNPQKDQLPEESNDGDAQVRVLHNRFGRDHEIERWQLSTRDLQRQDLLGSAKCRKEIFFSDVDMVNNK